MFESLIFEGIFNLIGRAWLYVRYRDTAKVEKILHKEYHGLFSIAGRIYVLNFIAGVGALSLSVLLIMAIFTMIWNAIVGE